jgi:pilus assembly protein Flp/PilA
VAKAGKPLGGLFMELIRRFVREEEGQGLVEYALIIGLIAVVAIAALTASGGSISSIFNTISGKLSSAETTVSS